MLTGKQVMRQSLFTDATGAPLEQSLIADASHYRRLIAYAFALGAVAVVLALVALVVVLMK